MSEILILGLLRAAKLKFRVYIATVSSRCCTVFSIMQSYLCQIFRGEVQLFFFFFGGGGGGGGGGGKLPLHTPPPPFPNVQQFQRLRLYD